MNDLIDELIAEKEWSIREFQSLKIMNKTLLYGQRQEVIDQYNRMCIPYIYAHWEGYVVQIFRKFVDYINSLKLIDLCVNTSLVTFSKMNKLKKLKGNQDFKKCKEVMSSIYNYYGKPLYIDFNNFTTKSNLNYNQLCSIFNWFELPMGDLVNYRYIIDKLDNVRNSIAHGENGINISYKDIDQYTKKCVEIMDIILLEISNYIIRIQK